MQMPNLIPSHLVDPTVRLPLPTLAVSGRKRVVMLGGEPANGPRVVILAEQPYHRLATSVNGTSAIGWIVPL